MPHAPPREPGHEPLLADLDEHQREAVTTDAAPLAIVAGPGAGKTRVLTRRIAWQVRTGRADARHVLAVTFTRKAAGELVDRLDDLGVDGVTAGTVHAVALAQLRRRADQQGRAAPGLLTRKARLLVPMLDTSGSEAALAAAELASEIEWSKARLITPDTYAEAVARGGRITPRPAPEVAEIFARYEREKRRRRLVDFDDLLWICADALERDPEFAATQRWRFRHLFVDEFQDVSRAQLRLIRAWLGDRNELCVVGDPDQAIYGFAGAEPAHLGEFTSRFRTGRVVRLEHNYRSSAQVLAAAEALLADGGTARPRRHTARGPGPEPTIRAFDTDEEEARGVATALSAARGAGEPWSSIAVLYRTNAQSVLFEEAFTRAGIPYRVRGDARFLERPEVRATLDGLRTSARNAPGTPFTHLVADVEGELEGDPSSGTEGDVGADSGTSRSGVPAERREHVEALARLAREYLTLEGEPGSVDGFLAYLTTALRGEAPAGGGDAVELLTFHRAKGLEFRAVFVTGLERGLVPIAHAEGPAARAEERRLLYVALTRAEHTLHLSYARQRTLGSRTVSRAPSPWIAPIEQVIEQSGCAPTEPPRGPTPADLPRRPTRPRGGRRPCSRTSPAAPVSPRRR